MIDTEKNNSIIDRKNMMIVYKAIRRYKPMIDRVAIIGTIYNIVLMLKKPTFIYNPELFIAVSHKQCFSA